MPRNSRYQSPKDWSPKGKIPGMPVWPEFVDAYLEAALWSSSDSQGSLDRRYSLDDFSEEAISQAVKESNDFIEENMAELLEIDNQEQNGHDFWLTRNHHGAGFWGRGYDEELARRLTKASHDFGGVGISVGDDGKLYFA